MYTQLTFQSLSPSLGSRQTIDLSSFVTVGSTGVALFFENTNFGNATIGACHPSQTTIRSQSIKNNTGVVAFVGIDGSRQVDVFLSSGVNLSLIGEFDSEAEFLTQDVDKTPVSNNAWVSTAHAETSTAKFAIYNIVKSGDPDVGLTGVRHGDSIDDSQTTSTGTNTWAIVPLNTSFECDLYKSAGYQFFLVGFIDSGATAVEAPEDVSTATTGSWEPITPTTTADYYIVQYRGTHTADANGNQARLSESNVGTNALGKRPAGMHTAIIKDNGAGNIYQNIGSADYDFFIVGSVSSAPPSASLSITDGSAAFGDTLNFTISNFGGSLNSWTMSDGTNTINMLSGSDTTAGIPALGNDVNRVLTGTITVTVGDGTDTAQDTFTLTAPAGYTSLNLASGFDTSEDSYLFSYGGTPAIADEVLFVTADVTLDDLGGIESDGDVTTTVYVIDATDGFMESFVLTLGPPVIGGIRNTFLSGDNNTIGGNFIIWN